MLMLAQHRQGVLGNGKGVNHSLIYHSIRTAVIQVSSVGCPLQQRVRGVTCYTGLQTSVCSREHLVQTELTPSRDEKINPTVPTNTKARLICLEYINHSNLTLNRSNTELMSLRVVSKPIDEKTLTNPSYHEPQFPPKYKLKFELQQ